MRVIQEIIENMDEELEAAGHYADLALKHRDEDKVLANSYWNMSLMEMKHYDDLHTHVVRIINAYREKHGDPPAEMKAVYDWEHQKAINKAKEIKVVQEMYKM